MQLELKDLLYLAQGVIIPFLIQVISTLRGLRKDLETVNKEHAALKEWQDSHDARCNERHEIHRKAQENIWGELRQLRRQK